MDSGKFISLLFSIAALTFALFTNWQYLNLVKKNLNMSAQIEQLKKVIEDEKKDFVEMNKIVDSIEKKLENVKQ